MLQLIKRNNSFRILFLGLILLMQTPGEAQQWNLKKEKDGIKIFTRKNAHSAFDELKVETVIPGKLSALAAVLLDIPGHVNWVYAAKSASVVKKISESELIFYTQINSPFPATDRDLVVHLKIKQDASTRIMTATAKNVQGYVAPKADMVRVPLSNETWTVSSTGYGALKIEYYLEIDPGGSAPAWLLNIFSEKGPLESFRNLKTELQSPKYQNAVLPFIKN